MPDTKSSPVHGNHRLALFIDASDQSALVLGGGHTAARKVQRLLASGLSVSVFAPTLDEALATMHSERAITFEPGHYAELDMTDARIRTHRLLVIATGDRLRDRQLAQQGLHVRLLVNVASQPDAGNFLLPSMVDRSPLLVAISSGGTSPVLSRLLRLRIEAFLPARYSELAHAVDRYRLKVREHIDNRLGRRRFWEQILGGRAGELMLQGRTDAAAQVVTEALEDRHHERDRGEVYLVGAGPGDPDLLSFRALRLIQQADVVLYDRLVSDAIMAMVPESVERVYVGKRNRDHTVPQTGINELLVQYASAGKRVLRLKGGDPFIFGRGGEEIEELAAHGINFQVVPGVTSASGCAAYAGIPLTHRDHSQACLFITGHLRDGSLSLDWQALTRPRQTVVIYMGLSTLPELCDGLIQHGLPADTPAALVSRGTTARQRVLADTVVGLPRLVRDAQVEAPTLIIVGHVVRLRDKLAWFEPDQVEATLP